MAKKLGMSTGKGYHSGIYDETASKGVVHNISSEDDLHSLAKKYPNSCLAVVAWGDIDLSENSDYFTITNGSRGVMWSGDYNETADNAQYYAVFFDEQDCNIYTLRRNFFGDIEKGDWWADFKSATANTANNVLLSSSNNIPPANGISGAGLYCLRLNNDETVMLSVGGPNTGVYYSTVSKSGRCIKCDSGNNYILDTDNGTGYVLHGITCIALYDF